MTPSNVSVLLCLFTSVFRISLVAAIIANPKPFRDRQPNGEITPLLQMKGGPRFHCMFDKEGFSVIQDENNRFVYATQDMVTGRMIPTDTPLGGRNTSEIGLVPNIIPNQTMTEELCGRMCERNEILIPATKGPGKRSLLATSARERKANLVILIKFADHVDRKLPPPSDFEILFNNQGPSIPAAPTGSVRDFFLVNSYSKVDIQSTIYGWIDLPHNESYYANMQSGLGDKFLEALVHALDIVEADSSFSLAKLDYDGDGFVDIVTLIHSGYGAEWGMTDADGQVARDRIWSHKWTLPPSMYWESSENISVGLYVTSTALWNVGGEEIGRIGVIVHEIGHALGLPDLYGGFEDNGIGSFGTMGNSWGFDGSQLYPPMMSAWAKMKLGWVFPVSITQSGIFSIVAAAESSIAYRIDLNKDGSEYLLIENRQRLSFDYYLPHGGLAIWHIDETAGHTKPGFPGQSNWPQNGMHYRVALLQADGAFDLENGVNSGDRSDLFRKSWQDTIGPSLSNFGPYPNTDAYQSGKILKSNVTISKISSSGRIMSFLVDLHDESPSVNTLPTPQPGPVRTIETDLKVNNRASGIMFDLIPAKDTMLIELSFQTESPGYTKVEVWTRSGSHMGYESDASAWKVLLPETYLQADAEGFITTQLPSNYLIGGTVSAIYVTTTDGSKLLYANGVGTGSLVVSNLDIELREGVGKQYSFGDTFPDRRWNGSIRYMLTAVSFSGDMEPTSAPKISSKSFEPTQVDVYRDYKDLVTTFAGGTGQAGVMFDVLGFKTAYVSNFALHLAPESEVDIEIYTRLDSFVSHQDECDDWDLVARIKVLGKGKGQATLLPEDQFEPVPVPQFRIRSFYISVVTKDGDKGMRYSKGVGTGSYVSSDDFLAVFEGVGKSYPCDKTFESRIWNGAIKYFSEETMEYNPTPTPSISVLNLKTTLNGGRQAAGIMFDIEALESFNVKNFRLNMNSASEETVQIFYREGSYVGKDGNPNLWHYVVTTKVMGRGKGEESVLLEGEFEPISVMKGHKIGLYITLTSSVLIYSVSNGSSVVASNGDLIITEGVGKQYLFGDSFSNRAFNGIIEYTLV